MAELALVRQALVAWSGRVDGYSLALGAILGVAMSCCIVVAALLLFGGGDTRPDDWRPTLVKWRKG